MNHAERRQHIRHSASYAIALISESEDGSELSSTGYLHDISDSGVSFVSHNMELFQLGQMVKVSILAEASNAHSLHAMGEIMWVVPNKFELNHALIGLRLEQLIESKQFLSDS